MTDKKLADVIFPRVDDAYNDRFYAVRESGTWDLQSVDSLGHFFKTYWAYKNLPNIHLFHYSDMKKELKQAISSMGKALDLSYDDVQLNEFTRTASFENIKKSANQFAPESGIGM